MKAILLVAIFALTASALTDQFSTYQAGFNDQLGLNGTDNAYNCESAVLQIIANAQTLTSSGAPEELAFAGVSLYSNIKNKIASDCGGYVTDILKLILVNGTTVDDLKDLAKSNFAIYAPYVIQQATLWIDAAVAGDLYKAGQTEASIVQILFGIEQPPVLPLLSSNSTTEFDQTRFTAEFYGTYLTRIGMKDQDVNDTVQCLNTLPSLAQRFSDSVNALSQLNTIEGRLNGTKTIYADIISTAIPCIKALKASWNFSAAQRNLFLQAPVVVILTVLHNVGLNLPQITQALQNQQINVMAGNYTDAGELMAQVYKMVYNGIF